MRMPEPDAGVLSRRERIVGDLARIVPGESVERPHGEPAMVDEARCRR